MKTKPTCFKVFLIAVLLMITGKFSNAQTFNYFFANDHLVSVDTFEFDVMIQNTSGGPLKFRTGQHCFTFNPSFINGATVVPSFVSTGTSNYTPGTILWSATAPGFSTAVNTGVTCPTGTFIPVNGTPVRVATFRMVATSGVFGCAPSNPNMAKTGETATGLVLRMAVTRWNDIDGSCPTTLNTNMLLGTYSQFANQTLYGNINNMRPTITQHPVGDTLCAGPGTAVFTAAALGNGTTSPLQYQWLENGFPIADGPLYSGTQTPTLTITNPSFALNGNSYQLQAFQCSPSFVQRSSNPAILSIVNSDDGNACTIDGCNPLTGTVTHLPAPAGSPGTDDGLFCTTDVCDANGNTVHNAIPTDDNNPCTFDYCDEANDMVTNTPTAAGTPGTSDGLFCTNDVCDGNGNTVNTPVPTDDSNPCTADACNEATDQITHTNTAAGTPGTSDGLFCTNDVCDGQGNTVNTPVDVNDNNACTADACDEANDAITHTNTAAGTPGTSDGLFCTNDVCDGNGNTVNTPVPTDDSNPCTVDACNEATDQITHTNTAAGTPGTSDGLFCTNDVCDGQGNTVNTPVDVNDNNACTADACDEANDAITHTNTAAGTPGNSDGLFCTNDVCDGNGNTVNTPVPTDDSNPCTVDACNEATDQITHTNTAAGTPGTSDGLFCTNDVCDGQGNTVNTPVDVNDNNACTADACDEANDAITHTNTAAGTPGNSDGLFCTNDVCDGNGNTVNTPVPTDDSNPCTVDACNEATDQITHTNTAAGTPGTSDGLFCTNDVCDGQGNTVNTPVDVNDNNACTADACDEANDAITHTNTAAGTPGNSDGLFCTNDVCDGNGNTVNTPVPTDDSNPCTADACNEATDQITHTNTAAGTPGTSDGLFCTNDVCDGQGNTVNTPVDVNDNNACTADACDEANDAITHTNTAAGTPGNSDGLFCTNDVCDGNGNTVNTPVSTDDSNPCTADACNEATDQITHTPVAAGSPGADDGLFCTDDVCNATGQTVHNPVSVTDNNACTVDACDEANDAITHTNTAAGTPGNSDGLFCTNDVCDGNGNTVNTPVSTDDSNPCTADACNESTDQITHTPVAAGSPGADDGLFCTDDVCNATGQTVHNPVSVTDNNACTVDACDEATDAITHTNTAAGTPGNSDGLFCTNDVCDGNGNTVNTPVSTDDSNPCTADACNEATDQITHTPVAAGSPGADDGLFCTDDVCNANGQTVHNPVSVTDNNACTVDACDEANDAITHTNTAPGTPGNSDGLFCTTDVCDGNGNTVNNPTSTDDSNPCTADACNETTDQITHTPVAAGSPGADDGLFCTTDVCNAQGGTVHNPIPTNDSNPCTIDACDEANDVVTHAPTAAGTPGTSDGVACTADICDGAGNTTHPNNSPSVTATAGTILCNGGTTSVTVSATGGVTPYSGTGVFPGIGAGTYSYDVTDAAGCTVTSANITISQPTKVTVTAAAGACSGSTGSATATPGGGTPGYSYLWSPSGGTGATASGLANGSYTVRVTDANGCSATSSPVTINCAPVGCTAPGAINGPSGACRNTTVVYSIAPVPGAISYVWTVPSNSSITGSSSGTSVSVCFNNSFSGGYICVKTKCSSNPSVYSAQTCKNIVKISDYPSTPGSISGPSTLCPLTSGTFSISAVSQATSYSWSTSGNLIIVSGQGTTSIVVSAPAGFSSGSVKVKATNCKGSSGTRTKTVTGAPGSAPVWYNSGDDNHTTGVCGGAGVKHAYEVAAISGINTFKWTAPAGAVINDRMGHTGNPLTVTGREPVENEYEVDITFPAGFSSGAVTVAAVNSCGTGPSTSLTVACCTPPATPGSISGNSSVCRYSTKCYSISSVPGATSYTWSVSGGATVNSGQGTTNACIKFNTASSSSATVKVKANNSCGTSAEKTKSVYVYMYCKTSENGSVAEGIESMEDLTSLNAYPNPTSGIATLSFNSSRDAKYTLKVVDMIGKVLIVDNIPAVEGFNTKEINLENVAKGLYLVSVQTEGGEVQTLRLVVE